MSPSKTMAARRQMRTPGERTSGAWTGGCAIHPDGGDETDRTAGNSYTATPHNTQGANSGQVLLQPYGEPVTDCRAQPSLESNYATRYTMKSKGDGSMRAKEIKMEVTYTEGYERRFTAACLEQIRRGHDSSQEDGRDQNSDGEKKTA